MKVQIPLLASILTGTLTHAASLEHSPPKLRSRRLGATITTGSNQVDFETLLFPAIFTSNGFEVLGAAFKDAKGSTVGTVRYESDGSTFRSKIRFDLHREQPCNDKILTIDLRPRCGIKEEITVATFDIGLPAQPSTRNSERGLLDVWGGGCASDIPVFADYAVGINGAEPVGDLWQSLTFYFGAAGCTFDSDIKMIVDSDVSTVVGSEASCRGAGDLVDGDGK